MTKQEIENIFTYHKPSEKQIQIYPQIREKAKEFALLINELVPPSAEQTTAIRRVQEAVMFANAGIALHDEDNK